MQPFGGIGFASFLRSTESMTIQEKQQFMKKYALFTVVAVAALSLGACKHRNKDCCAAKSCCATKSESGGSYYGK